MSDLLEIFSKAGLPTAIIIVQCVALYKLFTIMMDYITEQEARFHERDDKNRQVLEELKILINSLYDFVKGKDGTK